MARRASTGAVKEPWRRYATADVEEKGGARPLLVGRWAVIGAASRAIAMVRIGTAGAGSGSGAAPTAGEWWVATHTGHASDPLD